jgi:hypothetical protein
VFRSDPLAFRLQASAIRWLSGFGRQSSARTKQRNLGGFSPAEV